MTREEDEGFLREAIALADEGVRSGRGGPFGAVVVLDGEVLGRGHNEVIGSHDPTAHAEVQALRAACAAVGRFHLHGAVIYSSCEPCPMCLGAIYWARVDRVVYAADRHDAATAGFVDARLYEEIAAEPAQRSIAFERALAEEGKGPFATWGERVDRVDY